MGVESRPRSRISGDRYTGEVTDWRGRFGWVQPDSPIDHPEASKHNWRVYVASADVAGGNLWTGAKVGFFAYADGDGIGAEEVALMEADLDGDAFPSLGAPAGPRKGKGKGKTKEPEPRVVMPFVQRTIGKTFAEVAGASGGKKGKGKGKLKGKGKGKIGADRRKTTHSGGDGAALAWVASEMQGWRPAMEDASCALLPDDASLPQPLAGRFALFGVFDGHGGPLVSARAAAELPAELGVKASELCLGSLSAAGGDPGAEAIAEETLSQTFQALDARFYEDGVCDSEVATLGGMEVPTDVKNAYALMGTTAVVALVECEEPTEGEPRRPLRVAVANCGDSRAMICRGGVCLPLTEDHKPDNPIEQARIEAAGGFVGQVGPCVRVDGWGLNLSRALGDFHYKARADLGPAEQKVSCVPDVRCCELEPEDEFLLLCCDGVFELHSNEDAVEIVRSRLQAGSTPRQAVEDLVDESCSPSLFQTGGAGGDNVTALLVLLQ